LVAAASEDEPEAASADEAEASPDVAVLVAEDVASAVVPVLQQGWEQESASSDGTRVC